MSKAWHAKWCVFSCSIQISRIPSRNSTPNYWNKSRQQNDSRLNSKPRRPTERGHKSGRVPRRCPTLTLNCRNMTVGVISLCILLYTRMHRSLVEIQNKLALLSDFRLFGVACNRKEGRDDTLIQQQNIFAFQVISNCNVSHFETSQKRPRRERQVQLQNKGLLIFIGNCV